MMGINQNQRGDCDDNYWYTLGKSHCTRSFPDNTTVFDLGELTPSRTAFQVF